ncbi:MAG: cytochrome bd ubiquinol oxidase subunit [Solirubrobacteraceae bacterium]|jgi:cytochrome d ubiquinol oxidase subunit II|nr:cytochrome bd ubiquinol oxidase subunit [Solirubrobacteraceae bacterium]MEA2277553.1 cytochrome bd ubiquinol oxidase subunit [Solirubrobacteraceae bacterium]
MSLADACAALMVVALTAYATLGGADFGAGFWDLTAGRGERGARIRTMIRRSMSPVWEANHVWLIFVLVVFWTAFPVAFGSVFSTLYVPLFLAGAGIILRGTAFALRDQATTVREERVLGGAFAVSSVLTPFCLAAALGAIASGRVPIGNAVGSPLRSWLNPTGIVVGALAVLTGTYLSAVYLAADSVRARLPDLARTFRGRALASGVAAGAVAIGGLVVLRSDARVLYHGLTTGGGLPCLLISAAAGVTTLVLVWRERFPAARFGAAVAVAGVTVGWALAQQPYLLPPRLTIARAAAGHATLVALLAAAAVGLVLIAPALVLLYRLVLRGWLDPGAESAET